MKGMPQHRHQRLRARIDAQALSAKRESCGLPQVLLRRQLMKQGLIDREIKTRVAAFDRMTYPVSLFRIEEQDLVGFSDGIVLSEMTQEDTAIREDQMRGRRALLRALVAALSPADDISNRGCRRLQKKPSRDLRVGFWASAVLSIFIRGRQCSLSNLFSSLPADKVKHTPEASGPAKNACQVGGHVGSHATSSFFGRNRRPFECR